MTGIRGDEGPLYSGSDFGCMFHSFETLIDYEDWLVLCRDRDWLRRATLLKRMLYRIGRAVQVEVELDTRGGMDSLHIQAKGSFSDIAEFKKDVMQLSIDYAEDVRWAVPEGSED